jgi:Tol biopolymer transport system component
VTFIETGTPVRTVSTDGAGKATATLDTPGGFEGEVLIDVVVSDPGTGLELGRTTLERRWVVMQGNIFFWEIWGAGGNIRQMPANLSAAPTVFRGTSYNGRCAGCHTVSPGVVPSTGRGAIFVQDRVSAPYYEQIVDTQTNAVLFQFPGDSSDNDWSPDSSKVAWSNGDLYVFDTNTGANTVVAGANTGGAAEVFPTYSSDGSHIAYTNAVGSSYEHSSHALSILGGTSSIRTVNLATGATSELVPATPGYATFYPEFSPDGRWLVYNKSRTTMTGAATPSSYSSSTAEMWIVPVDPTGAYTTGPARQLTTANGSASVANSWPTWAPDSTFIAFGTNRSGDWDVYVSAISGSGTDSPAVPLAYGPATAAGPNGEHIPAWGP